MEKLYELKSLRSWPQVLLLVKSPTKEESVDDLIFVAVEDPIFHDHQQLKTRGVTLTEESPTLQDMNKFAVYCLLMPLVEWLVTITASIIADMRRREAVPLALRIQLCDLSISQWISESVSQEEWLNNLH